MNAPTCVDLFAGGGGFSEGARIAGARVLWAANHNPDAVACHAANHPDTEHACQDLHQADWSRVPAHDVLLASPACTGHSLARGKDRPKHDKDRSTAWAVVSALEFHRPPAFIVENVEEFANWVLFDVWKLAIRRLGYSVSLNVIDAADLGVPQNRVRLFIIGTLSKFPLVPRLETRPHAPAWGVVDFGAGRWTQVYKPGRAERTLARVAKGREQHGDRFLMSYYGTSSGGRSLDRPVGTLTTRARWAIVDGDRMRMLSVPEASKAMGFPPEYQFPGKVHLANHLIGNAVSPTVAAALLDEVRRRV